MTRKTLALSAAILSFASGAALGVNANDDLRRAVLRDLRASDAVEANSLRVRADDGTVTLSGTVPSAFDEMMAKEIASSIRGTTEIVDELRVADSGRSDSEIRRDVQEALVADPAAEANDFDIEIDDGMVELSGEVQSWAERRLAVRTAMGVRGVRGVDTSGIEVVYESDRPDTELRRDVVGLLQADTAVDASEITVRVNDGVVALSGTIDNLYARDRAEMLAWVYGVEDVDDDALVVEPGQTSTEVVPATRTTDAWIAEAVRNAAEYEGTIDTSAADVDVTDGVVYIEGEARTLREAQAFTDTALTIAGVDRVVNLLTVQETDASDADLRRDVQAALLRDPYLTGDKIAVGVVNGVVRLTGDADTTFERNRAARIAAGVAGVRRVDNRVDGNNPWVWKPDGVLKEDVEDQLFWSAFTDSDDITVSVDNGVVTLAGTVDSYSEVIDARENALDAKPKSVRMNLRIGE